MNRLGIRTEVWLGLAVTWMIVIVYLSLTSTSSIPNFKFLSWDKIVHAAVYFILAVLFIFGLKPRSGWIAFVLISCVVLGVLLEVMQGLMAGGRTADIYDAIANALGVLTAYIVCSRFLKLL